MVPDISQNAPGDAPKRRRFQIGLSTLLVMIAAIGVALAAWRLRPSDPVFISTHRIEFPPSAAADRKAAAKSLYDQTKQKSLVGKNASTLDELFYAVRIEVHSTHIEYTLDMEEGEEGQEYVFVIVETRTGIVTNSHIGWYSL